MGGPWPSPLLRSLRALAERRRDHHLELYKSGRWKRYYTEQQFIAEMRNAIAQAQRWANIAPRPEELVLQQQSPKTRAA